jgi:PAS domain-containing protein
MKNRLADLLTIIATGAASFSEPILAQLCRLAAMEAENAGISWSPDFAPRTVAVWDWDVANDLNHLDPVGAELFGVSPSRASKGLPNSHYLPALHPDDLAPVSRSLANAVKGGVFEARYRIIMSGEPRCVFAKGFCFVDRSNRPERFVGTVMASD